MPSSYLNFAFDEKKELFFNYQVHISNGESNGIQYVRPPILKTIDHVKAFLNSVNDTEIILTNKYPVRRSVPLPQEIIEQVKRSLEASIKDKKFILN